MWDVFANQSEKFDSSASHSLLSLASTSVSRQSIEKAKKLWEVKNQGWTFYDPTYQCALVVWLWQCHLTASIFESGQSRHVIN